MRPTASDPERAAVGADRGRPLPPRTRRQHRARQRATRPPTRARDPPKGIREQAHRDRWKPELYRARHLLLKASERLTERDRRLCAMFERDPLLAEA
jgi:hypothetical protein